MIILLIILCFVLGLFMMIRPESTINIHNMLFMKDDTPSDFYLICLRVVGGFVFLLGIIVLIFSLGNLF